MRNGSNVKSNDDKIVPLTAWVFGEIAPRAIGALHQASGNHYVSRGPVRFIFWHSGLGSLIIPVSPWEFILINDNTWVKDTFMPPRKMAYLFDYQLMVLNLIPIDNKQMESRSSGIVTPLKPRQSRTDQNISVLPPHPLAVKNVVKLASNRES